MGCDLARHGNPVLGVRLPGHGTAPSDLRRVRAQDWLMSVLDGVALLREMTDRVVLVGFSLGGALALIAAAQNPVSGVVAMATPYESVSVTIRMRVLTRSVLRRWERFPDATPHPHLGNRHQLVYPAYAVYPTSVERQLVRVQTLLDEALPEVRSPALIVHSNDDPLVSPACAERIYTRLGSDDKQVLWLDGVGHSVVRAARRQELFDQVAVFLERIEPFSGPQPRPVHPRSSGD